MMESIKNIMVQIPKGSNKWVLLLAGGIAVFVLVVVLIFYGWFQMLKETNVNTDTEVESEMVSNFGTENDITEIVPNFGTMVTILNLEQYATPLLDDDAVYLEVELSEYASRNELDEKESIILHVIIPEENENQLFIFCKFSTSGEIVQLVFDREKDVCIALKSCHTEEEILNEIWNGDCPAERDIPE